MTKFHAVMLDETRCEFGVEVRAKSRAAAYDKLRENYPESSVVQIETQAETRRRERSYLFDSDAWDRQAEYDEYWG